MERSQRILSIQSHVVSGYCGNKSATFPLQLLEFEVDVVNSVQLSNHTQYKTTKGQIFGGKDLDEIVLGLKSNNLLRFYDHILSGYVADVGYIKSMGQLIKDIKDERSKINSECLYTFDPVLGDDGVGFYVPQGESIIEAYKKYLLPHADIITPNRFEASALSGLEIESSADKALPQAIEAMNYFHELGVRVVVITSFSIDDGKDQLTCILSYVNKASKTNGSSFNGDSCSSSPKRQVYSISIPKLDCPFTGAGDLFAALITGWLRKTNFDLKLSLENTLNSIHDILEDTLEWFKYVGDESVQSHELRLVQNKTVIMQPSSRFKAQQLDIDSLSNV